MVDRLLRFLEVDDATKASGVTLSKLLAPQLDGIIERFYSRVREFGLNPHVNDRSITALRIKQKQHWIDLFNSQFDENYLLNTRRIAVRHRGAERRWRWALMTRWCWIDRGGGAFQAACRYAVFMVSDLLMNFRQ